MNKFGRIITGAAVASYLTMLGAVGASAFTLNFTDGFVGSTNDPATGSSGTAEFSFSDVGVGIVGVSVKLTNTTGTDIFGAGATDSFLNAFGFDIGEYSLNGANGNYSDDNVEFDFAIGGITGDPNTDDTSGGSGDLPTFNELGDFGAGTSTGSTLIAEGSATDGLDVGEMMTFTVQLLTGTDDALDVADAFENGFFADPAEIFAMMRFKGVLGGDNEPNGGSDKLLFVSSGGEMTCPPGTVGDYPDCFPPGDLVVPLPAGLPLVLTGIGVFGYMRARKRKSA